MTTYIGSGETDGYQYVFIFIVVSGMLYNPNFWFYLRASRCSEGCAGTLLPVTFLNKHINKTHLLYTLRPVLYTSDGTLWTVVPGMHGTHCKYCSLIPRWFLITTSICSYVDVCMLRHYYTYLDIWVKRVISINIKNSNDRFIQVLSLSFYISIACLLYMYTRRSY